MPFPSLNPTPPEGSALRRALIRLSSARKETLPPVFRETGGRVFFRDFEPSRAHPHCITRVSQKLLLFGQNSLFHIS
jgi:hypothetical protein